MVVAGNVGTRTSIQAHSAHRLWPEIKGCADIKPHTLTEIQIKKSQENTQQPQMRAESQK